MKTFRFAIALVSLIAIFASEPVAAQTPDTSILYQHERMRHNGTFVNGWMDVRFRLFNRVLGGTQIGPTITKRLFVRDGLMDSTPLDFGAGAFTGTARWMQVWVRPLMLGTYLPITPRQKIIGVPFALNGGNATPGPRGLRGLRGLSAYDVAVANGFVGDATTWMEGLEGDPGPAGPAGPAGAAGANGLSAYEVAVINGFVGTEADWLDSIEGAVGPAGAPGAPGIPGIPGPPGATGADGVDGAQGDPGPAGPAGAPGADGVDGVDGPPGPPGPGSSFWEQDVLLFVHYDDGPVGIGTNGIMPAGQLHVVGGPDWTSEIPSWKKSIVIDEEGSLELGRGGSMMFGAGAINDVLCFWHTTAEDDSAPADYFLRVFPSATSPNLIGGFAGNSMTTGVVGATVAGGGTSGSNNLVGDNFGTVGGGLGNQAGDNAGTVTDRVAATVAGGLGNTASGSRSSIGGGTANTASNAFATIAGGLSNVASGLGSTVGGGATNTASGINSTIPGGELNEAVGNHSLAAGLRAQADHAGAFVWADATNADFTSTADNQFLIRAAGGVGIGTNAPDRLLSLADTQAFARLTSTVSGSGSILELHNSNAGAQATLGSLQFLDSAQSVTGAVSYLGTSNAMTFATDGTTERVRIDSTGRVGIGITPSHPLHMASGARCTAGGVWSNASDRNLKENFAPVNGREVLEAIANLPITRWNYKNEDAAVAHVGPMAQDFRAAFKLGDDDVSISTVDASGVALAAIQGVRELLKEKDATIAAQQQELQDLRERMTRLEKLMTALDEKD